MTPWTPKLFVLAFAYQVLTIRSDESDRREIGAVSDHVPGQKPVLTDRSMRADKKSGTRQMLPGTGVSVWWGGQRDYLLSASTRRSTSSSTLPVLGRSR